MQTVRDAGFVTYKGYAADVAWSSFPGASGSPTVAMCEGGAVILGPICGNRTATNKGIINIITKRDAAEALEKCKSVVLTSGVQIPVAVCTGIDPNPRSWAS